MKFKLVLHSRLPLQYLPTLILFKTDLLGRDPFCLQQNRKEKHDVNSMDKVYANKKGIQDRGCFVSTTYFKSLF